MELELSPMQFPSCLLREGMRRKENGGGMGGSQVTCLKLNMSEISCLFLTHGKCFWVVIREYLDKVQHIVGMREMIMIF